MSDPPTTKTIRPAAQSPRVYATTRLTVVRVMGSSREPVEGATVTIPGVRPEGQADTTNSRGQWTSRLFRAGSYDVTVSAPGSGPLVPGGGAVVEANWIRRIRFEPSASFPAGVTPNDIQVEVAWRNPIIRVRAFDPFLSPRPLAGARVEIIGVDIGTTDVNGEYSSPPVPYGTRGVRVGLSGYFPQAMHGPEFFRQVEIRETASAGALPWGRDMLLRVELSQSQPLNLPGTNANPIAVWASGGATPHSVASDPRLPNPGGGDTSEGQDGWDVGIVPYSNFRQLARALGDGAFALPSRLGGGTIQPNQVRRLAIVAHGGDGVFDVDQRTVGNYGIRPDATISLTLPRLSAYEQELELIAGALAENSVVYLTGCQLVQGQAGEDLLRALSARWPTSWVVGSTTFCATTIENWQDKPGTGAQYPGIRQSDSKNNPGAATAACSDPALWRDLNRLPWFSEHSRHSTVARDGNIIRRGD
jgi:hypothetical protein